MQTSVFMTIALVMSLCSFPKTMAQTTCKAHTDCTTNQYCFDKNYFDTGVWSGSGFCSNNPSDCCAIADADPIDKNTCNCPAASKCTTCFTTPFTEIYDKVGTIPAYDTVTTEEATGLTCLKFILTLTGGADGDIISAILTKANAAAIDAAVDADTYASADAFAADVKSKAATGSLCTFEHFATQGTCTKIVQGLSPTETYVLGAANKDTTESNQARLVIETCGAAASSANSLGSLSVVASLLAAMVLAMF